MSGILRVGPSGVCDCVHVECVFVCMWSVCLCACGVCVCVHVECVFVCMWSVCLCACGVCVCVHVEFVFVHYVFVHV